MNKKILGIGILFLLLAAGTVMAFRGDFAGAMNAFDSDEMQQMKTAIENGDYETWKTLQEQNLTEENFNAIRERTQQRIQNREEMQLMQEEIQTAIENQDYTAWKALMEENNNPRNTMMLSVITEDNFSLFSEMHNAMQSGDIETAKTISEELGLEQGIGFKERHGMSFQFNKNFRMNPDDDSD